MAGSISGVINPIYSAAQQTGQEASLLAQQQAAAAQLLNGETAGATGTNSDFAAVLAQAQAAALFG